MPSNSSVSCLGTGTVRLPARITRQGSILRRSRQRAPRCRNAGWSTRLSPGAVSQARRRLGNGRSSTRCSQGLYAAASAVPESRSRHLCRPGTSGGARLLALAWRHQRRIAADPRFRRRQLSRRERACAITGATTLAFFAPETALLCGPTPLNEFKTMVNQFHAHGHRDDPRRRLQSYGRRQRARPTLSFKGIDNASYYRLRRTRRYYINDTGTGTRSTRHPRVLQMVADSLRYWATEMRVDGFRFDLATILGARALRFRRRRRLSRCLPAGSRSLGVKLIAEPWDIGLEATRSANFRPAGPSGTTNSGIP